MALARHGYKNARAGYWWGPFRGPDESWSSQMKSMRGNRVQRALSMLFQLFRNTGKEGRKRRMQLFRADAIVSPFQALMHACLQKGRTTPDSHQNASIHIAIVRGLQAV